MTNFRPSGLDRINTKSAAVICQVHHCTSNGAHVLTDETPVGTRVSFKESASRRNSIVQVGNATRSACYRSMRLFARLVASAPPTPAVLSKTRKHHLTGRGSGATLVVFLTSHTAQRGRQRGTTTPSHALAFFLKQLDKNISFYCFNHTFIV